MPKRARARTLIEAAGCRRLFLPTSSPDFNPIAPAFSQLIESTFAEHQLILGAIRARDPKGAEREMYDHVMRNKEGVVEALLESNAIRSINLGAAG